MIKEFTRVRKDGVVINEYNDFVKPFDIVYLLKQRGITGKYNIEHVMEDSTAKDFYIYCIHFIRDTEVIGIIYPYGDKNRRT